MEGSVRSGTVLVCLALAALAGAQKISPQERRQTVIDSLSDHPALQYLDLDFCGSGSESQISRGPLGCGFPVAGDHPWLVALGFSTPPTGKITYSCAGALVSDQFVVTSANCALGATDFTLTTVRVGEYDFGATNDCLWYAPEQCLQAQDVGTSDVMIHPKYKRTTETNFYDIALIRLKKPLVLAYGISPICLPIFSLRPPPRSQRAIAFSLRSSAPMTDSGAACCNCSRDRGAISHVMDAVKLANYNETYDGAEPCHYKMLGDTVGGPATCIGGGDPCMADEGGPMVSADRFGGAYFLLGVAAKVPTEKVCKAQKDAAVVYVPVRPHAGWLLKAMDSMVSGRPSF